MIGISNLIVAFTSEDEWEEIHSEAIEFLDQTRYDHDENKFKVQIFIIVIKDFSILDQLLTLKEEKTSMSFYSKDSKRHRSSFIHAKNNAYENRIDGMLLLNKIQK